MTVQALEKSQGNNFVMSVPTVLYTWVISHTIYTTVQNSCSCVLLLDL